MSPAGVGVSDLAMVAAVAVNRLSADSGETMRLIIAAR
jgi:hypothetical protein